jgi:hypothetical protein
MKATIFGLVCFCVGAVIVVAQSSSERTVCRTSSLITDSAPTDPNADHLGPAPWYINANRSIWAGPVPKDGWASGGRVSRSSPSTSSIRSAVTSGVFSSP